MINSIILGIVRVFIERQVIKFGKALDWNLVKSELDARIRKMVPGEFFDDTACFVCMILVDLVAEYFQTAPLPEVAGSGLTQQLDSAMTHAQNNVLRAIAAKAMK